MERKSVVITDLDNTLFDWVEMWHRPFVAMLDAIRRITQIDERTLLANFKEVFSHHRTTEYALVIQELPCLLERYPEQNLSDLFAPAIQAHRIARREVMRLYPTVEETLIQLKACGCLLIGYTESSAFYTHYRLRKLGLDLQLDMIYSPPDHDLPEGLNVQELRGKEPEEYRLRHTAHRFTPPGEVKPNSQILAEIIDHAGANSEECVYVGDSLMKDIAMAQQASVTDVWAAYGAPIERAEYELLRSVTHWSDKDVRNEKLLTRETISPQYVLRHAFAEILPLFDFAPFRTTNRSERLSANRVPMRD